MELDKDFVEENDTTTKHFTHLLDAVERPFYWVFLIKLMKHYGLLIEDVLSKHNTGTSFWYNALIETCRYFGLMNLWYEYVSLKWYEADCVDAILADRCLEYLKELEVKYVEVD